MKATSFLLVFLFIPIVFSYETDFFAKASVHASLDTSKLYSENKLLLYATVENTSAYVLLNAYLVAQLVLESDDNDFYKENIFSEYQSKRFSLLPGEKKEVKMVLKLSKCILPKGNYRIDLYLKTPREYIQGVPYIFAYSYPIKFRIEKPIASENCLGYAVIDRKNTTICGPLAELNFREDCYFGPVGVIVNPNEEIPLNFKILNPSKKDLHLKLLAKVYYYDDTLEENFVSSYEKDLGILKSGTSYADVLTLKPINKPGAYSIKLELFDADKDVLLSLFRHRVNVTGVSSRIVAMQINKPYFLPNEKAKILVKLLAPSDHKSEDKNAKLYVEVSDSSGRVFQSKRTVKLLQGTPITEEKFEFIVKKPLKDFNLTVRVLSSENKVLDSYSYHFAYAFFKPAVRGISSFIANDSEGMDSNILGFMQPIFVRAYAYDVFGSKLKKEIKLYIVKESETYGPYLLKPETTLQLEPLKPGKYTFRFSIFDFSTERLVEITKPEKFEVKISSSKDCKKESTNLKENETIYICAKAYDSYGNVLRTPVLLSIEGPITKSLSFVDSIELTLPKGAYKLRFTFGEKTIEREILVKPFEENVLVGTEKPQRKPAPKKTSEAGFFILLLVLIWLTIGVSLFILRRKR